MEVFTRSRYLHAAEFVNQFEDDQVSFTDDALYYIEARAWELYAFVYRQRMLLVYKFIRENFVKQLGTRHQMRAVVDRVASSESEKHLALDGLNGVVKNVFAYRALQLVLIVLSVGAFVILGPLVLAEFVDLLVFASRDNFYLALGIITATVSVSAIAGLLSSIAEILRFITFAVCAVGGLASINFDLQHSVPHAISVGLGVRSSDPVEAVREFFYGPYLAVGIAVGAAIALVLATIGRLVSLLVVLISTDMQRAFLGSEYVGCVLAKLAHDLRAAETITYDKSSAVLNSLTLVARMLSSPSHLANKNANRSELAILRRRFRLASRTIIWYRTWIVIPGATSKSDLTLEIERLAIAVLLRRWDDLPGVAQVGMRERPVQVATRILQQIIIGLLPGATLVAVQVLGLQLDPGSRTVLVTVSAIWAGVTLIGLIDPALNSRISVIKDVFSFFKPSAS